MSLSFKSSPKLLTGLIFRYAQASHLFFARKILAAVCCVLLGK